MLLVDKNGFVRLRLGPEDTPITWDVIFNELCED